MRLRMIATACLVLPFMMGCPSGQPAAGTTPTPVPSTAAAPNTITIASFQFTPATLQVTPGTTVTWVNNDSASHTVTADDQSFDAGTLAPGRNFTRVFDKAGTFAYHCNFHPSMKATVTVK